MRKKSYLCSVKQSLWVILALLLPFCGCSQNAPVSGSSEKPNNYDSLVVVTEDYLIYLSFQEYTDITLSATDPALLDFGRYRIPTKDEAAILHTRYIQAQTSQRFLCIAPDGYYSFCFSKVGNITKAGSKTIISGRMFGYNEQPTLSVNTNYAEEKQIPL